LAITAIVGPPTYPAPMQQIFSSQSSLIVYVRSCISREQVFVVSKERMNNCVDTAEPRCCCDNAESLERNQQGGHTGHDNE
jgi:hypothetical protein